MWKELNVCFEQALWGLAKHDGLFDGLLGLGEDLVKLRWGGRVLWERKGMEASGNRVERGDGVGSRDGRDVEGRLRKCYRDSAVSSSMDISVTL